MRTFHRVLAVLGLLGLFVNAALSAPFETSGTVVLSQRTEPANGSAIHGFVGTDGREYLAQALEDGTALWDIQDPTNPVLIHTIPGPLAAWRVVLFMNDFVYSGPPVEGGLQVIDVSDPTNPALAATYTTTLSRVSDIAGDSSRDLLYVTTAGLNPSLRVLDTSAAPDLTELGVFQPVGSALGHTTVDGTVLYVTDSGGSVHNGQPSLRIVDVADPTSPTELGTYSHAQAATRYGSVLSPGAYLLLAQEVRPGPITVVDVSDPQNISEVSSYDPYPGEAATFNHVVGTTAFVAGYRKGLRILDVSNPLGLTELAFLDATEDAGWEFQGAWDVYPMPSGNVAVQDGEKGLFLVAYDPDAGRITGTVSSSTGGLLEGATVEYLTLGQEQTTGPDGAFEFSVISGASHTIRVSAYAHDTDTQSVSVGPSGTVFIPVTLNAQPHGTLAGRVTDTVTGTELADVDVAIPGEGLSTRTDANGDYSFPFVEPGSHGVQVVAAGYGIPAGSSVSITAGMAEQSDFALHAADYYTDFSDPGAWTVEGSSSSMTGPWQFGEPGRTDRRGIIQTGTDHTPGLDTFCAVTGQLNVQPWAYDVDGGTTKLLSPVFDLSGMVEPHVYYFRWYAWEMGSRDFVVKLSTDGGTTWPVQLERTGEKEAYWKFAEFDLTQYAGDLSQAKFRFLARDAFPDYIVEAAVDDFTIYDANGPTVGVPLTVATAGRASLGPNRPNPFRTETSISFSIPRESSVVVSVYDVRGTRVATLFEGELPAGDHEIPWDGRTDAGLQAASGVYFSRLETPEGFRSRKLVRLE